MSVTPEKDFLYMARGALVLNPRLPRSFGTATFYTASNKSITNVHRAASPQGLAATPTEAEMGTDWEWKARMG